MKLYAIIMTILEEKESLIQEVVGIFTEKEKAEIAKIALDPDNTKHSRISELELNEVKAYSESDVNRLKLARINAKYHPDNIVETWNDNLEYRVRAACLSLSEKKSKGTIEEFKV